MAVNELGMAEPVPGSVTQFGTTRVAPGLAQACCWHDTTRGARSWYMSHAWTTVLKFGMSLTRARRADLRAGLLIFNKYPKNIGIKSKARGRVVHWLSFPKLSMNPTRPDVFLARSSHGPSPALAVIILVTIMN